MLITSLAWVSAREARGRDDDEEIALEAIRRTGVAVEVVNWDDPDVEWSRFDRAVTRSTWDYAERLPEFLAWVDRVEAQTELVNSRECIEWNVDKQYLGELSAAGIPITPTMFVAPGETANFPAGTFVVKPAVGAGSRDVAFFDEDTHESAQDHVNQLHAAGKVVLVQPFIASVPIEGEWPLLFFNGEYSHAASKRVLLPSEGLVEDLFAEEANTHHVASASQIEVASSAVAFVCGKLGTPTYCRVDLVKLDDGQYGVLEIELVEPSLFLPFAQASEVDAFARAITQ